MKSIKYFLPLIVLFLSIGYAATNVTLSITGDVITMSDIEDFDVYISDIKVSGVTDISVLNDTLSYSVTQKAVPYLGSVSSLYVDIKLTNSSRNFDAIIDITCSIDSENVSMTQFSIYNPETDEYNSNEPIKASTTNVYYSDFQLVGKGVYTLNCNITAEPVERTELGVGETPDKIEPPKIKYFDSDGSGYIDVGDVVDISGEKFNIISADSENVVMLAYLSLNSNYKQSTTAQIVAFSDEAGWKVGGEVDIQTWSTNPKTYINNYVKYLEEEIKTDDISGDLINYKQLTTLGCPIDTILSDVTYEYDCSSSIYSNWLFNTNSYDFWWTNTSPKIDDTISNYENKIYVLNNRSKTVENWYNYEAVAIRPTVTIPYTTFKELSKTPKKSLISFTIDGTSYQGVEGMTWGEWVNSEYNTAGFYITNNHIGAADSALEIYYAASAVSKTQKIGEEGYWQYELWPA